MADLNAYFNPLNRMTREEFEYYTQLGRIWSTRARFNQHQARMVMGEAPVGYYYQIGTVYYEGYIITTRSLDEEEAKAIAGRRGWNEEVCWLVTDGKPLGYDPMQLFKN